MIFFRPYKRLRIFAGLALICLLPVLPAAARAQTPFNIKNTTTAAGPGTQQPAESIDDALGRLGQSLLDALQKLKVAQEAPESIPPARLGATPEELQSKLNMLYERVRTYQQNIEAYKTLKETRAAREELAATIEGWMGFEETSPYPVSMVDELRNEIRAQKLKIKKEEAKLSIANADLDEALKLFEASDQRLRSANEKLEGLSATDDKLRLQWLQSLSQLENSLAKARVRNAETQRMAINEALANYHQNLAFLERKLQTASSSSVFSKEEYESLLALIAEARKEMQKKLLGAIRDDLRAREELEDARRELTAARESLQGQAQADQKKLDEIDRFQTLVDMRTAWSETASQIVETLELSLDAFNVAEKVWEERYRLRSTWDENVLTDSLREADKFLEELRSRQSYFVSNLELTRSLLVTQQNRLATLDPANGSRELVEKTVKAYSERAASYGRALAHFDNLVQLVEYWRAEVAERRQRIPIKERLVSLLREAAGLVSRIWHFELFSATDTIIIDGQPITEQRPVTVSKLVRALIILAIGLWLSAVLARRMRAVSVKHFKVEQAGAGLIEKTIRTVVIISVVFFALVTVKIPLTVFAFLGGALAIGVGFGAQNLINNFISGIILLFERPIRVGDIVEIDGTRGRVTGIGARCSEIRLFGGIDMLVPNSMFLEKSVVNWTLSDRLLRLSVTVGVAYGSPTEEVSRIIAEALKEHEKILGFPEPVILFEEFGDSSLVFTAYFWIEVAFQMDYRIVASDLRHILDKRLKEAGITIAFPQRDVHLDHPRPIQVELIDKQQLKNPDDSAPGPA